MVDQIASGFKAARSIEREREREREEKGEMIPQQYLIAVGMSQPSVSRQALGVDQLGYQ